MEKLSRDELFTLALYLDLPDLLNFCKVKRIYQEKLCNNYDVWRAKIIRDFPNFQRDTLSDELKRLPPQELYVLLYTIKVWKLNKTVDELYFAQQLHLHSNQIIAIPENFNLPNLQELYLSNNQITSIPENLNFPKLQVLFLNNNRITSIPEKFEEIVIN